jgi:hypothetical protein
MKYLLIILTIILFSFSSFAQKDTVIYFSIGMGYKTGIDQKVEKYLEKKNYEILFFCNEQKIFVIRTKVNSTIFFNKIDRKFNNIQFVPKKENDISNYGCKDEYKKIRNLIYNKK